jgi:hypothetical protein
MSVSLALNQDQQVALTVILGLGWLVAGLAMVVLIYRSPEHRIDNPPGHNPGHGASRIWQVNVFNPRNYGPHSRPFYWQLVATLVLEVVLLLGFLSSLIGILHSP